MGNEKREVKGFKMLPSIHKKALRNARFLLKSNLNAEVEKRVTEIANLKPPRKNENNRSNQLRNRKPQK